MVPEITVKGAGESANAMNTQLQELEQLATAMNEMAVTATEVANNAQGAAATREADEATLNGTSVVSDTTQAVITPLSSYRSSRCRSTST